LIELPPRIPKLIQKPFPAVAFIIFHQIMLIVEAIAQIWSAEKASPLLLILALVYC
jgi:hypothetical protein